MTVLPYLRYLDLSYNKLSTLNQNVFESYMLKNYTKWVMFNIKFNHFKCECDMHWVTNIENSKLNVKLDNTDICLNNNITTKCWFRYREKYCPIYNRNICTKG